MTSSGPRLFPIDFKTRFDALDGIRALAVTMVFLRHFGGGSHGGMVLQTINHLRERGWIGVDIFFVLSGFLITGILYDTRNDSRFFSRFYARRSLRIFPLFYLIFVVVLVLTPVFHYQWRWLHLTFLVYLGNFFGNRDFSLYEILSATHPSAKIFIGHFWSLCVEEQFYLLWPLVVWWVRDRVRLLWVAGGLSLLALVFRGFMCLTFDPAFAERWVIRTLPFRMDDLLIGAILALLLRGPSAESWQRSCKWVFLAASGVTLAIFTGSPEYDSSWLLTVGLTAIGFASAGLIGMAVLPGSRAFRLFSLKPLKVLGKYSYGFYIFHVLCGAAWTRLLVILIGATHSLAVAGVIALSANFCVSFLIAKLSYDLYEVRFLRYKKHFEYDSEVATREHAFASS
jgi:peptidoglycan/LPS O-acetylase OafA/YrhL